LFDVGIELAPTSNIPSAWHTSTFSYTSTQETIREVWIGLYQIIGRANFAIEGIEKMEAGKIDTALKNRLLAEARFLRGWAYFDLAFNWGRVPLTLSVPTTAATSNKPRSQTEKEIYEQAISDFEFAEANLPVSYPSSDLGRITKGAAVGYLGKIYLYMASPGVNLDPNGYSKAEGYFKRLVEGGEFSYNLVPEYIDNFTWFNENNQESLFEVQYATYGGNSFGFNSHDSRDVAEGTNRSRSWGYLTWFNAMMRPSFVSRFPDTDPRLRYTAYGPPTPAHPEPMKIFGGVAYDKDFWAVRKYERYDYIPASQEVGDSPINFRVLRFADVLLMYAEALNEQGKTPLAIPHINRVRARASVNLPPISATDQAGVRQAIRDERLWELGLEQIRKKDVLRWGADVAENEFDISGIEAFDYAIHRYLPIPQSEVDANLSIENTDQNPGY
jgi:hypothetical protein